MAETMETIRGMAVETTAETEVGDNARFIFLKLFSNWQNEK